MTRRARKLPELRDERGVDESAIACFEAALRNRVEDQQADIDLAR